MSVQFHKYHVCGNDIVVVDGRDCALPSSPGFYRQMADRRTGVGFDQAMILLSPDGLESFVAGYSHGEDAPMKAAPVSELAGGAQAVDAGYVVINADGSLSEQCGNGLCAMAVYSAARDGKPRHSWRGLSRIVATEAMPGGLVAAEMGAPDFDVASIPYAGEHSEGQGQLLTRDGLSLRFSLVSMGNPHAVIFLGQDQQAVLDQAEQIGAGLNSNRDFPDGVNVSLVMPQSAERALVRVYERGAGPTLACGSASCAVIACARRWFGVGAVLDLDHPGGRLSAEWAGDDAPVFLRAHPQAIFTGQLDENAFKPS